MSKSFQILIALLLVSSIASATETRNIDLGFYENQTRIFPIESLTETSGCSFNFGDLDVKEVNASWPHYITAQNLVKVGFDAIKPNEIKYNIMKTACTAPNCSIYVIDDKGCIYKRWGNVFTNGTWRVQGDTNLSDIEPIKQDKFLNLFSSNDELFTMAHTTENTTRFILGLKPNDEGFNAGETNFETPGALPDSEVEYIRHAGNVRSLIVLPKVGDGPELTILTFEEKASVQTPNVTTIKASDLQHTNIWAIEADAFKPEILYVLSESSITTYNVSDIAKWVALAQVNVSFKPEDARKGGIVLERKMDLLALAISGNNSVLVFDISKPNEITYTGLILTDNQAEKMLIDFSEKLSYLYLTRPGATEEQTKLTIYDMRLLTQSASAASNAIRFSNVFNSSSYVQKQVLSVNHLDNSSDLVFWSGIQGDIYKFYDKAGIAVIVGAEEDIVDDTKLTPGPRPGSYIYNYSFTATPYYCPAATSDFLINVTLRFILPMRKLAVQTSFQNKTVTAVTPGLIFDGPVQTILIQGDDSDKLKDKYNIIVNNPLETKTDVLKLFNPVLDILVEQFTERGRAYLLIKSDDKTETPKADMSYRIVNVNMTIGADEIDYSLNQGDASWSDIAYCMDLFAMKDAEGGLGLVVTCAFRSDATKQRVFTYANVSTNASSGTVDIHPTSFQDIPLSLSPLDCDIDKNVLFQVFDSDENNGVFTQSIYITLPGLNSDPKYQVLYKDILGPKDEPLGQASILNFDVVAFDNDEFFEYAIAATTSDLKLIVLYIGNKTEQNSYLWFNLEDTAIFGDKIFENPFFSKVEWVNDDCLKLNHKSAFMLLISPNFYSYKLQLSLTAQMKPTINVINGFSYYPEYRTVDSQYDSCSNTFVTLTNITDPGPIAKCFMVVFPGNTTNSSSFNFTNNAHPIVESVGLRGIPCPYLLRVRTLGSERIANETVISFALAGEVVSLAARLSYGIQIKNISLPANVDGGLVLNITAFNPFSALSVAVNFPTSHVAPTPGPGPAPGPAPKGGLTWLWVLLGIAGLILIIAAVVWVLRNKKVSDEPLLDGKNDMSLQVA